MLQKKMHSWLSLFQVIEQTQAIGLQWGNRMEHGMKSLNEVKCFWFQFRFWHAHAWTHMNTYISMLEHNIQGMFLSLFSFTSWMQNQFHSLDNMWGWRFYEFHSKVSSLGEWYFLHITCLMKYLNQFHVEKFHVSWMHWACVYSSHCF